eukprot:6735066-Pyramimonas_sp.AAC.1
MELEQMGVGETRRIADASATTSWRRVGSRSRRFADALVIWGVPPNLCAPAPCGRPGGQGAPLPEAPF